MRLIVILLLSMSPCFAQAQAGFERGIDAYRHGEYAEAETLWRETLEEELAHGARARLYYNLGNAAWRQDHPMEAVGWYSACLRISPRDSDTWRNLFWQKWLCKLYIMR